MDEVVAAAILQRPIRRRHQPETGQAADSDLCREAAVEVVIVVGHNK